LTVKVNSSAPPVIPLPVVTAVTTIKKTLNIESHDLKHAIASARYTEFSVWSNRKRKQEESRLDSSLVIAIKKYTGPLLRISSGKRTNGFKKSLHRCGKAIDASYCKKVMNWLLSSTGEEWAKNNHIRWYIEDTKKHNLPHFRVIPWASGLHFHLEHDH
jgi:hypothetical protein